MAVNGDAQRAADVMLAVQPLYEKVGILTDGLRAEQIKARALRRVLVVTAQRVARAEDSDLKRVLKELQALVHAEERELGLLYDGD